MFGRNTDNSTDDNDQTHLAPAAPTPVEAPKADGPMMSTSQPLTLPEPTAAAPAEPAKPASAPILDNSAPGGYIMDPPASTGVPEDHEAIVEDDTVEEDHHEVVAADPVPAPIMSTSVMTSTSSTDDLDTIKQRALQQLSPLVGHLELSPEDKFRTTMMMLQATDNPELVKDVYAAAQAITDEKTRAQALLDVVNEINYFNQQQHAEA